MWPPTLCESHVLDDTIIGRTQDWGFGGILKGAIEGNVLSGVDAGRRARR